MKLGFTWDANFHLLGEGHACDPPDSPAATLLGAFSLLKVQYVAVIWSSHLILTWIAVHCWYKKKILVSPSLGYLHITISGLDAKEHEKRA